MNKDLALFVLRFGIGIIFMVHGWPKIIGGPQSWSSLGGAMGLIGIQFFPMLWGFLAAINEFFGGILLALGFGTRIVSFFLAFQMVIALLYHLNKGDSFMIYSHPLSMMIVFIALMISGAGSYSVDFYLR